MPSPSSSTAYVPKFVSNDIDFFSLVTRIASAHLLNSSLSQHLEVARPERFELPTLCFEGRRSIQLSYGRTALEFDCKSFRLIR